MGTIKLVLIGLVILGVFLYIKQPDTYSKTYGFAWDKAKETYNGYMNKGEDTTQPLHQEYIEGNQVVSDVPDGYIFGKPYDIFKDGTKYTFPCTNDAHCYTRYTSRSKCLLETGECYQPKSE